MNKTPTHVSFGTKLEKEKNRNIFNFLQLALICCCDPVSVPPQRGMAAATLPDLLRGQRFMSANAFFEWILPCNRQKVLIQAIFTLLALVAAVAAAVNISSHIGGVPLRRTRRSSGPARDTLCIQVIAI